KRYLISWETSARTRGKCTPLRVENRNDLGPAGLEMSCPREACSYHASLLNPLTAHTCQRRGPNNLRSGEDAQHATRSDCEGCCCANQVSVHPATCQPGCELSPTSCDITTGVGDSTAQGSSRSVPKRQKEHA